MFGNDVVDHKSRNKIQEAKSKANPSVIPSGRNNIPDVRNKIPGLRNEIHGFPGVETETWNIAASDERPHESSLEV